MSINSKVRRQAGKRKIRKADATVAVEPPIEPHAELRDQQGALLAGIVRRDGEWVLGMGGRIAGHSTSAAHVLALIQQAGKVHEQTGNPARLLYSDALRDAAQLEVAGLGLSFEQFSEALLRKLQAGEAVEGTG